MTLLNRSREAKFRRSPQLARTGPRSDENTAILRFPREDHRLERLVQLLEGARFDPERALHLARRLQSHIEDTYRSASLFGDFTWRQIPRFDPALVKRMRWVINYFVAEANIQLVFGERGSFKSTLFLAAAKAVAAGEEFLGMKTRRRRVLYLDYENPANIIKGRNDDLQLNLPHNEDLVVWDRFRSHPPPRPGDPILDSIVRDCIADTGYAPWIIFDSWSSLLKPGEGGEFTGQIAPLYLEFRKLADLGATVTIIDHSKKHERGTLYGGQDKEAKVDSIHKLLPSQNKVTPQNPIIRVESWLKRHAPQGEGSFAIEVQSAQDKRGNWHIVNLIRATDPFVVNMRDRVALLRDIIEKNPKLGQDALAKLASVQGIPRDQAIDTLKERTGIDWRVERVGHNKFSYSLLWKSLREATP